MDNILKQNRFDNVTHRVYTHTHTAVGRGWGPTMWQMEPGNSPEMLCKRIKR